MEQNLSGEVRIVYERSGFDNEHQHRVRSAMESRVCDWLMKKRIAHRHGSEVFTIPLKSGKVANVYVPDIVLHDMREGKRVIIEPFQVNTPKSGGTRALVAFRKVMKDRYYVIIVARKSTMKSIVRGSYDAIIDIEKLDQLEKKVPLPKE